MNTQNQATFDHVARKLAGQGRPSFTIHGDEGNCLYRGPDGVRCAAGHCFEGEVGVDFMEDRYCTEVRIASLLTAAGHNPRFVRDLQRVHDQSARRVGVDGAPALWLREWATEMRRLARNEGLSTSVLDAALASKSPAA